MTTISAVLLAVSLAVPTGDAATLPSARPQNLTIDVLQEEIAEASRLSTLYFRAGLAIDNVSSAGTANNEADFSKHSCFILGRMLGMGEIVKPFEVMPYPDFDVRTSENAHDLRVLSNSMLNYAIAGKHIAALTEAERALEWNLDCAAQASVKRYSPLAPRTAFVTIEFDGEMLKVLGDITDGFATRLRDALDANPGVTTVALGSGGGSVYEALQAGRMIRTRGLATALWNNCYSACPLVFAGGKERVIYSPYPSLGFHEMSIDGVAVPRNSSGYAALYQYLKEMGVQPDATVATMWKAPPSGMHMVEGRNPVLCRVGFATWIQRICDSDDRAW